MNVMVIRVLSCLLALVFRCVLSAPLWVSVCQEEPSASLPFCNLSLPLQDRVHDYVSRVPTENQIQMMSNQAQAFEELNVPSYNWWSEGLHGAREPCVQFQGECRCPTSFPCPSGLANSFNTSLFSLIGRAIALEGKAISNLRPHDASIGDGLTYWSPVVNLQRDPRWGRNQEAPGEDPLLTSAYAQHFIQGLQQQQQQQPQVDHPHTDTNSDRQYEKLHVAACCKHFVANSLENWHGHTRHNFDAQLSKADLYNYYLPPFQQCVEANVAGIMCSYNAVNGMPSCVNNYLLKDTVRDDWNFQGYIVTDCGALQDTITGHHVAVDATQASAMALNATVDVNCGKVYSEGLLQAYKDGWVTASAIQDAFARLARIQFRLGLFDHPKEFHPKQDITTVGSHDWLALQAAQQSIVLLKNHGGLLPLLPDQKLAVVGPHIHGTEVFFSNYHGSACGCPTTATGQTSDRVEESFDCIQTPVQALSKKSMHPVDAVVGCSVADTTLNDIDAAVQAANDASAVIVMVGLDQSQEREALDRNATTLPGLQQVLVSRILEVASEKTVLVLVHGGAMSLGTDVIHSAAAILTTSYGGQAASQALTDVLFGDYNPTGKLAATMYPPSFVDQLPLTEMGLQVGVGRTHMYYKDIPEFRFGHGLSYSQWSLKWADTLLRPTANDNPFVELQVSSSAIPTKLNLTVTNLGPRSGSQTVLLFWRPTSGQRLQQKLAGFNRTTLLNVGESESLEFRISQKTFFLWDDDGKKPTTQPGIYILDARASNVQTSLLVNVALPNAVDTDVTTLRL